VNIKDNLMKYNIPNKYQMGGTQLTPLQLAEQQREAIRKQQEQAMLAQQQQLQATTSVPAPQQYFKTGGMKYEAGGAPASMYGTNRLPNSMGSTASIVFQETSDERLKKEEDELATIKSDETWKNAALEREATQSATDQAIGTGVTAINQGSKAYTAWAAKKAAEEAAKTTASSGVIDGTAAIAGDMVTEAGKKGVESLGADVIGTGLTTDIGGQIMSTGANVGTELGATALQTGSKEVLNLAGKEGVNALSTEATKGLLTEGIKTTGTELGKEGVKELGKEGVKAVAGETVKGAAVNINPYAAAANIGGKAISAASDDNDASTWNTGEATGDILGTAGEYASYGAIAGSIVPGVGNVVGGVVGGIVGAGVGLYRGLTNKSKGQDEKEAQEEKIELAQASTDALKLSKKQYSGFDFGNDVVAKNGGYRYGNGGMKYGHGGRTMTPRAMSMSRY
tara:strand:- start:3914 stop:5272 length:1359 start_codon:yes stop_codon:yes gene_type:complete